MEDSNKSGKNGRGVINPVTEANEPIYWGQGWAVYSPEAFFNRIARDKGGQLHQARIHIFQDSGILLPWQRNEIYKLQDDVFSIVTQRAQIISGMPYKIIPSRNMEDEIAEKLKEHKFLIDQIGLPDAFDLWANVKRNKHMEVLIAYLGELELRPDLSNFDACLRMWSRKIKMKINVCSAEIEDWLSATHRYTRVEEDGEIVRSSTQGMQDLLLQWVSDMMIHGNGPIQLPNEDFDGLFVLPGGSIFRIPGIRVGMPEAYVQLMYGSHGYGYQEPVWFYPDQISMAYYMPSSSIVNGLRPLDAVMQCVATSMSYETLMGRYTNNEIPVEKLLVILDDGMPVAPIENTNIAPKNDTTNLERTEEVLNSWQKNKNVRVRNERGKDAKLLDLSRGDWLQSLDANRERIRKAIGRAFSATPNEMGETGVDSGMIAKGAAEAQSALYNRQGIRPLCKTFEYQMTQEILPYRFGKMTGLHGLPIMWEFVFGASESDTEKFANAKLAAETQSLSKNEIREKILGYDRTDREEDDTLIGAAPQPTNQDLMAQLKQR